MSDRMDRLHSHHEGDEDPDQTMTEGAMDESMDPDAAMSETSE